VRQGVQPGKEPIAIVGIGCRFPGHADSPEAYWQLLAQGKDCITQAPADRWNSGLARFLGARPGDHSMERGGFLQEIDRFDADFFGISPREAARMDPQQRLLLEVTWEALEDAGIAPEALAGSPTGVFIGISTNDYGFLQANEIDRCGIDAYTNSGAAWCIAANRISFILDFCGPSLAVDTACSSSLTAVALAAESLRAGRCSLAVAGGVGLLLRPESTLGFTRASMLSPDAQCRSFDARADGYVRSEGAGVVVLKPLREALAAHDPIYAVVRGAGINQNERRYLLAHGIAVTFPTRSPKSFCHLSSTR
jgi:acyl transferase domain-containing protein